MLVCVTIMLLDVYAVYNYYRTADLYDGTYTTSESLQIGKISLLSFKDFTNVVGYVQFCLRKNSECIQYWAVKRGIQLHTH